MHNNEQKQYKDFNILIKGPSEGFQYLMDDLNTNLTLLSQPLEYNKLVFKKISLEIYYCIN